MDPWSKVDYSRHIREASMEMEGLPEVIPPSSKVPRQRLLAAPILKRRRLRYREVIGKKTAIFGVSSTRVLYRRRGAVRRATRGPGAPLARPSPSAPGSLVVALWPHPGDSGRFQSADFYLFFRNFWSTFNSRKT